MSRLAKKSIAIPEGISVRVEDGKVRVKGPKGELRISLLPGVYVEVAEGGAGSSLSVKPAAGDEAHKANTGTMWSLIRNALEGVARNFTKVLELQGVGFRVAAEGKAIILSLGFSNPVRFTPPEGVVLEAEKNTIRISGRDKQLVGQTAARIRLLKKPEPYKGKGIRYQNEVVRIKAGKKAATTAQ